MEKPITDEELMFKYQQGDERAFTELYQRYSGRIYAYLKKRLNEKNWTDDVFQMVFVKLHKTRNQYDPSYRFDQWIFVMTKTVLLDFWKTTGVKTQRYFSESLDKLGELEQSVSAISKESGLPEPALAVLSSDQRAAVELKFIDEMSYKEIAEKLNRSEESVRQLMSRALKKMRTTFSGDKS